MRNVLLISWHDLARHIGCYGRPNVHPPRLDRFAAGAVLTKDVAPGDIAAGNPAEVLKIRAGFGSGGL